MTHSVRGRWAVRPAGSFRSSCNKNAKLIIRNCDNQAFSDTNRFLLTSVTNGLTFKSQLESLDQLHVFRCVKFSSDPQLVQVHGFSDASQCAYGACIFVRTKLGPNKYRSKLLVSKSIAPLKALSLPRLELFSCTTDTLDSQGKRFHRFNRYPHVSLVRLNHCSKLDSITVSKMDDICC